METTKNRIITPDWSLNPDSITYYEVVVDETEIPEFLNVEDDSTFYRAIGFAEQAMSGNATEEDVEVWTADMDLLEMYGVIRTTRVRDLLDCFDEVEQEAICNWFNETFFGAEVEDVTEVLITIRQNAWWRRYSYNEVDEDFSIIMVDPADTDRVFGF